MMTSPRGVRLLVLLSWLGTCGCAAQSGGFGAKPSGTPASAGALEALSNRAQNTSTVRGSGVFTGYLGRASGQYNFVFALRQPDRLRVDILDAATGVVGVLIVYEDTLYWYAAPEATVYAMAADAASLKKLAKLELMPQELIRLLAGLPPAQAAAWLSRNGVLLSPDRRAEIFFGADGRNVAEYREYRDTNQKNMTIAARFEDYRSVRGVDFPHRIQLSTPASGGALKVAYHDIEINPRLDRSDFSIEVPATTKIVQW